MTSGEPVRRRSVAVLGSARGAGHDLALGIGDLGAAVAVLTDESVAAGARGVEVRDSVAGSSGEIATVSSAFRSGADVEHALERASERIGRVDAVVDVSSPGLGAVPTPVAELDEDGWVVRAETPLRRARYRLQGAYRHLRGGGGRIVVILPSLSMTGASGLVPWVSVSEGYRALAKAAARAWGTEGITINCLAVPADLLAVGAPASSDPSSYDGQAEDRVEGPVPSLDRPGLPAPALGRSPEMRTEVAAAVATLLDEGFRFVTGATVAVDGGVWMTP
ncbi:MAG: SDR family oxidoreductase [Actinobacteria bacterium]|nr:MAG: SDR family oxidoreductase [Actinomycetota bacterium]